MINVGRLLLICGLFFSWTIFASIKFLAATPLPMPQTFLWAWQRKENLISINPKEFGVAYLVCHVVLTGNEVRELWRDQPLLVPPDAILIPVVRIDADSKHAPALSDNQTEEILRVVAKAAQLPRSMQVQIDFDALKSERTFYRQLLERIHKSLPATSVSITTLCSWGIFDNWIENLPVAETVPMLFSLGRERQKILLYFRQHHDFLVDSCRKSLGLSLEDTEVNRLMIPQAKQRKSPVRFYIFTKTPWNEDKIQAVHSLLSKP